ncbi:MAG TPA: 50S ribosomal protein L32e [Thermoplasmata archaeon]|nr:50S ribosomal protein L32e [Thermoplasmata archaeon]
MTPDPVTSPAESEDAPTTTSPAPKKAAPAKKPRAPRSPARKSPATTEESPKPKATEAPPPRRPKLSPELARLLTYRRGQDAHRPLFVRQAAHRYWRIGRDGAWRKPRGLQSKQRRHYGYRPTVVSIGFRSPRLIRGRTPTGFLPVLVRNVAEIGRIDPAHEAAVIGRTVGTQKRLVLEEAARKRGIHVLNPLTKDTRET